MKVFMFGGLGSQHFQMGKALFEKEPLFKEWMERLDKLVVSVMGVSIIKMIYNNANKISRPFDDTQSVFPAAFMVEYSLFRLLTARGVQPDLMLGSSLGEFVALVAGGRVSLEEGLKVSIELGRIFHNKARPGRLLTVLDDPVKWLNNPFVTSRCDCGGVNGPEHFILSGEEGPLRELETFFREKDIAALLLPLLRGYHSRGVDEVEEDVREIIPFDVLSDTGVPLYSTAIGGKLIRGNKDYVWEILRGPIRFRDTFRELKKEGDLVLIDLTPSGTFANLAKMNISPGEGHSVFPIFSVFGADKKNLDQLFQYLGLE